MSSLNSFIYLYIKINLILIFSWLLWIVVTKVIQNGSSLKPQLRLAQLLVAVSVLSPIVLLIVPKQHLPVIEFAEFYPANEVASNTIVNAASKLFVSSNTLSSQPTLSANKNMFAESINLLSWHEWIGLCIFLGFIAVSVRTIFEFKKLLNVIRTSIVYKRIGSLTLAVSDNVTVPFATLLFSKAWIILPLDILNSQSDFKTVVRHEIQHHRQKDTHWALFFEMIQCLFYFNPVVYLWKIKITELQELACDESVIGQSKISAHEYASCLLRVAEAALRERQMYVGTTYMAASSKNPKQFKSFLRRRIEMLAGYKKSRRHAWISVGMGTVSLLTTIAVAYGAEQSARNATQNEVNPGIADVDESIQRITETILNDWVKEKKASGGFAVVADPYTGRILAIVNIDKKEQKIGQWAQSIVMEAASIGKTLIAAEAIDKGLTEPQEKHDCENGNYKYNGRVYHDWKKEGWDFLTTEETITNSSDICSMKIGQKIGPKGLREMLVRFGFGPEGTAKSFPGARTGVLPSEDSSNPSKLIHKVAAGFGYKITPIEMLQAYGAIANGGNLMRPRPANVSDTQIIRRVMTAETSEKVKEILRQVVLKGTGNLAASDFYTTAGKTASAVFSDTRKIDWLGGKEVNADYAGFIGFAPVGTPRVEVFVGILDPKNPTGAHGRTHAGPVFKQITEQVLKHMKVAPDKIAN